MHLTSCLCSLDSFIDNGVMAFLRVLELLRSPNTFQAKFSPNSKKFQMVHHVDLLENYFLFVLNYIGKIRIANCRVYKGGVITWNMAAASQENYFMQEFHWLTICFRVII